MSFLSLVYIGLSIFGAGVIIADFFGLLSQSGGADHHGDDLNGDGTHDHVDDDLAAGYIVHDGDSAHGGDHPFDGDSSHDSIGSHDGAITHHHEADDGSGAGGSLVQAPDSRVRIVAKAIGWLRTGVYAAIGAGPTGLLALFQGSPPLESLLWASGAGVFIAVLAKSLRRIARREMDSSFKPEEFLLDEAEILVSVTPGAMGKALVKRYGAAQEIYVRALDGAAAFPAGTRVRIADFDESCYYVEAVDVSRS